METKGKRHQEIMRAVFDHYVRKRFLEKKIINEEFEIDEQKLLAFAKMAKCDIESLISTLISSLSRIQNHPIIEQQSEKDEQETIFAVIEFYVKGINIPLKNYRRSFGNMTAEINLSNPNLKLKTQELAELIYPVCRRIFTDIFQIKPLIVTIEA